VRLPILKVPTRPNILHNHCLYLLWPFHLQNEVDNQRNDPPNDFRNDEPGRTLGLIPANVSLNIRPTTAAGLAKEVEAVNQ